MEKKTQARGGLLWIVDLLAWKNREMENEWYLPQRHDCCSQWDARDGIEVGKVCENEVNRGKYHDEIANLHWLASFAQKVMNLLQWFPSRNHVHDVRTNLTYQLLWHHNPQPKLLTKGMLPQLVVPVKPFSRDHLMHLHHLPQCVQCYYPWQYKNNHTGTPAIRKSLY